MGTIPELLLPDLRELGHVERFATEGAHANDPDLQRVDLWDYTCACADFQQHRSHYPPRDIRRGCPHILSAIPSGLLHRSQLISALVTHRNAKGVPAFEHWAQLSLGASPVLFARPPADPEWVEVYAMASEGAIWAYHRFLWRISTASWKYGNAPRQARKIATAIQSWLTP